MNIFSFSLQPSNGLKLLSFSRGLEGKIVSFSGGGNLLLSVPLWRQICHHKGGAAVWRGSRNLPLLLPYHQGHLGLHGCSDLPDINGHTDHNGFIIHPAVAAMNFLLIF